MLLAVEKERAKEYLDNYFNLLSATGYVKHRTVVDYLVWLFMVDFVERVYALLSNEDYNKINNALIRIFSCNNCLLPYKTLRTKLIFGEPVYMGKFILRITEDSKWRSTEDERPRTME